MSDVYGEHAPEALMGHSEVVPHSRPQLLQADEHSRTLHELFAHLVPVDVPLLP